MCVLAYLYRDAGEFSFKKKIFCVTTFFPYSFSAFFVVLFTKQFSLLVDIFAVVCFSPAVLSVGTRFFCCSVVSFVLTFSIVTNVIFHQLFLSFETVPPPHPIHFCLVEKSNVHVCGSVFVVLLCS